MAKKVVPLQKGNSKRNIQKIASEPIAKYINSLWGKETQKSRSEVTSEYKKALQQGASMAEARKKAAQNTHPANIQKPVSDNRHKQSSQEAIHKTRWENYTPDTVTMNGRVRRKENNPASDVNNMAKKVSGKVNQIRNREYTEKGYYRVPSKTGTIGAEYSGGKPVMPTKTKDQIRKQFQEYTKITRVDKKKPHNGAKMPTYTPTYAPTPDPRVRHIEEVAAPNKKKKR